jgi:hypothetical protein
MHRTPFNKLHIVLVLMAITMGLVSLGIKLPSVPGISSSSKPKPRPRAIIVNQIIKTKSTLKALVLNSAIPTQFYDDVAISYTTTNRPVHLSAYNFLLTTASCGRAPPPFLLDFA